MTEFAIPMNDVPNEFTRLDESKLYVFRITALEIRKTKAESKTPGEPMIVTTCEVRRPVEWEGKTVTEFLLLPIAPTPMDSTAERRKKLERGVRLRQFMEACEFKWGPNGFSTDEWVGGEFGATIRNEEGQNGDVFSRIKKMMPASVARDAIDKVEAGLSPGADGPMAGVSSAGTDQGI